MTNQTLPNICFTILAALLLIGCNFLLPRESDVSQSASSQAMPATSVASTVTPAPLPAPTQVVATPPPTPISPNNPNPAELALQQQAMRPEFVNDVASVAAAGASRYFIEASLEPESFNQPNGLQLVGQERVYYTNTESQPLSEIYFRLYPNLPGYAGQMGVETVMANDQTISPTLAAENSALRIGLPTPLLPGQTITLSLGYTATVPTQTAQGYNIFSYTDGTAALAGFYPTIATYDERGWDLAVPPVYGDATYLDTSLYQVQVTVPEAMVVAATGNTINTQNNGDGTKTVTLVSGPVRDFYLAMRPDYEVISDTLDGITVNSYYVPGTATGGQLALQIAIDALRLYNQQFGPYPYAQFDVVATPTTAGGVEYPGIVVIAQGLYQHQDGFFQHVVAHEVAHQWWYGLVGNDQVHEPWLDEALTNYSAILYWENVQGQQAANSMLDQFYKGPYQQAKRNGQDRAVIGPVSDFNQFAYGAMVYSKGPLFFDALRQEVGDEVYAEIMQAYFLRHKYGIAQADDLFETIEQVANLNIEPLRKLWLESP